MKKYRCITACFRNSKFFNPGELLPEGMEPGEHFALVDDGVKIEQSEKPIIRVSGDDPRSTIQIIADLKDKYGINVPDTASKREAFDAWVRAEQKAAPKKETPKEYVAPVPSKRFADMTPDEAMNMKSYEITAQVEKMYGVELRHAGVKKEDLLAKAAEIEKEWLEKRRRGIV